MTKNSSPRSPHFAAAFPAFTFLISESDTSVSRIKGINGYQTSKIAYKKNETFPWKDFLRFKNRSCKNGFAHFAQVAMSFIDSSLSSLRPSTKARKFGLFFIERIMKFCCSLVNIAPSADSKTVRPSESWCSFIMSYNVLYVLSYHPTRWIIKKICLAGIQRKTSSADSLWLCASQKVSLQKSTKFIKSSHKSSNPFKSHTSAMQRPKCREKSSVRAVL